MSDARVGAWLNAKQAMEAATKMRFNHKKQIEPVFHQLHWALLTEAAIWADLACVDISVGLMVGNYLEQQERERIEADKAVRHTIDQFLNKTKSDDEKGDNA